MATFRDTREQLKDRLRNDLGVPQGEVADQVLEAAASGMQKASSFPNLRQPQDQDLEQPSVGLPFQALHQAIPEMSHRLSPGGHLVLVGHHHQGDSLAMKVIKKIEHIVRGA